MLRRNLRGSCRYVWAWASRCKRGRMLLDRFNRAASWLAMPLDPLVRESEHGVQARVQICVFSGQLA